MTHIDYGYGDTTPDYGYGDAAPETDYGYGDAAPETDYGYGDAKPVTDYGYGDAKPETDYGYGDAAPTTDYGYGDAKPATDYGYGDAKPSTDYGYGDAKPSTDYGYGDASPEYGYNDEPAIPPPKDKRPKRRCSVTKFSLVSQPTSETDKDHEQTQYQHPSVPDVPKDQTDYGYGYGHHDEKASHVTVETVSDMRSDDGMLLHSASHKHMHPQHKTFMGKGLSKMNKIRKRLSIAF